MTDRTGTGEGEWVPPAERLRWSEAEGLAMAAAFWESGLTAQEFAKRHGIGVWRVQRWTRARRSGSKPAPSVVKPAAGVRFAPVRIVDRASAASLDVVVGRAIVRVGPDFDADLLRRVVVVLGGATC